MDGKMIRWRKMWVLSIITVQLIRGRSWTLEMDFWKWSVVGPIHLHVKFMGILSLNSHFPTTCMYTCAYVYVCIVILLLYMFIYILYIYVYNVCIYVACVCIVMFVGGWLGITLEQPEMYRLIGSMFGSLAVSMH